MPDRNLSGIIFFKNLIQPISPHRSSENHGHLLRFILNALAFSNIESIFSI